MRKSLSALERYEMKVDRSSGLDGCHPWIGGFGQFNTPTFWISRAKSGSARRWLWEHIHGPLSNKEWVTPTCGNLSCVNPRHMAVRAHNDNVARFWEKVEKTSKCWNWKGHAPKGYGVFYENRKAVLAHRFSWRLHFGEIKGHVPNHPELEVCVCHRCDNPRCVRPDHLFLGSDKDNHDDMVAKRRHARGPALAEAMRRAKAEREYVQRICGRGSAE